MEKMEKIMVAFLFLMYKVNILRNIFMESFGGSILEPKTNIKVDIQKCQRLIY